MSAPITKVLLALLAFSFVNVAHSQLEVDEPILMVSPNEEDRQVKGLGRPVQGNNAVNATVVLNASLIFDEAVGTDQISIDLEPAISNYTAGLMLTFKPDAPNSGPATLSVNNLGAIDIKKNISEILDSADFRTDIPVTVIFDGTVFQVLGQYSPSCPQGYLEMTREYCIEIQPRPMGTFWLAAQLCAQNGARLCSYGEWHYACRTDQSFFNSISGYEWVDHAANNVANAKRIGVNNNGDPNCYEGGHAFPLTQTAYRCCYTK